MARPSDRSSSAQNLSSFLANSEAMHQRSDHWNVTLQAVAQRFDQEFKGQPFELPDEVKAMPVYQEWKAGLLAAKAASPFWDLVKPRKQQRCLDIGCGVSFLIYPWREWEALFFGQDISTVARDTLNSRGPQLNSKLFKGVKLGGAHALQYEEDQFDMAIATGFSCYYSLDYWTAVMQDVKRVLKPDGVFVFDIVDAELPAAENWAILETYMGTEVFLEGYNHWRQLFETTGAEVVKQKSGDIFRLFQVRFKR
jgi:SAM-dependent methyltransferase